MLLRQMKYFAAVVECGSFTEAAEQCYISQSAISQQIRTLEKELGVELLHRGNRKFTVTAAGEYFYSQCRAVLAQVEELVQETRRLGTDRELQLRIGYLRCYSGLELHQAVAEFSKIYPEVSIHIVDGTHEELYDLLRSGEVDLILSDQRRAFSDTYVNFELTQCGCCAEISRSNPLSGKKFVRLEELKRLPCILISSREQQDAEQEYYQHTLGFGGNYLFADSLEKGRRLSAHRKRGYSAACRRFHLQASDLSGRASDYAQLLCFLAEGAGELLYRGVCGYAQKAFGKTKKRITAKYPRRNSCTLAA